jgi:hypothetical protein
VIAVTKGMNMGKGRNTSVDKSNKSRENNARNNMLYVP